METTTLIFLLFTLVLSIFLGLGMASKTLSSQRDSFFSMSNIAAGVIAVGAILAAGSDNATAAMLGGVALACAGIKIVGSYLSLKK